jgi:hypothetical protein
VRGLAGLKCDECGHAMSRHNELNYCRHRSQRDGDCCCGLGLTIPAASPVTAETNNAEEAK